MNALEFFGATGWSITYMPTIIGISVVLAGMLSAMRMTYRRFR